MSDPFKCPKCGSDIADDALTCESCGLMISSFESNVASPNKNQKVIWQVVSLLVVVLIAAVIILPKLELGSSSSTTPNIPTTTTSVEDEIKSLEELYQAHPDHAPIALSLGNLHASQNNHPKAVQYYRSFLSYDTSRTGWEVRLDLAKSLFAMRKTDEAKGELNSILNIDSNHDGALYNLGAIEANLGNHAEAKRLWTQLLEHHTQGEMVELTRKGLSKLAVKND